jgi:hypothetical protein
MVKSSTKENVVIVGGGLTGTLLAKELSAKLDHSKYDLIVVETRPYLIWMLGGARMAVTNEKGAVDDYLFNYDKLLPAGKGTVKRAKVQKVVPNSNGQGGELELVGGEILPYRGTYVNRRGDDSHLTSLLLHSPRVGDWIQVGWSCRLPRGRRRRPSVLVPVATTFQVCRRHRDHWRRRRWHWYA